MYPSLHAVPRRLQLCRPHVELDIRGRQGHARIVPQPHILRKTGSDFRLSQVPRDVEKVHVACAAAKTQPDLLAQCYDG